MKQLVGILALVFFVSISGIAQEKKPPVKKKPTMTAEQMATLQSKKMALELDLDAKQQKAVFELCKKNAEERFKKREQTMQKRKEAMEKRKQLSEEERTAQREKAQEQRFERMNTSLDRQLVQKNEMKKILNEKQFEKWSAMQKARQKREVNRSKERRAVQKKRGELSKKRMQRSRSGVRRN